jgi:polar amino acid transport system substrate-binding protein
MKLQPLGYCLHALLLSMTLLCAAQAAEGEKVLTVRTDSWMPFNGEPGDAKPGYVIEVLKEIFEPAGIKVDYQTKPYKESLEAARKGEVDAVIGANEAEAEGLVIPFKSIGAPCVVLLTLDHSTFEYQNMRSLMKVKLGIIDGYSYWPALDNYITQKKNLVVEGGEAPLDALFQKLQKSEIEVLAENEPVLMWYLRAHKLDKKDFRAVYRHMADPIFVVFAKTPAGKANSELFDKGIQALRSSGRLVKILDKYGLSDWE